MRVSVGADYITLHVLHYLCQDSFKPYSIFAADCYNTAFWYRVQVCGVNEMSTCICPGRVRIRLSWAVIVVGEYVGNTKLPEGYSPHPLDCPSLPDGVIMSRIHFDSGIYQLNLTRESHVIE